MRDWMEIDDVQKSLEAGFFGVDQCSSTRTGGSDRAESSTFPLGFPIPHQSLVNFQ
jgi:hypothetical protein